MPLSHLLTAGVAVDDLLEAVAQSFLHIAEAKEKPGTVQLANSGMGNIWHLAAIGIELETGASFNHVPFDGAASAITAVLGGHVDAVTCSAAEAASNIDSG